MRRAGARLAQSRPKRKLGCDITIPEYRDFPPQNEPPPPQRPDPPKENPPPISLPPPAMKHTLFRSLEPLLSSARVQFRPSASGPLRALQRRRYARSPADDPNFTSVLDRPPQLVRSGQKKHGPGILVLGLPLPLLPLPPSLLPSSSPTPLLTLPPQPQSQSPPSSSAPGSCAVSAGKPT